MRTSTKKISLVEILSQTPRQTMPVFFTSYITANTALYAFRFWAWFSGRCYHTLTSILLISKTRLDTAVNFYLFVVFHQQKIPLSIRCQFVQRYILNEDFLHSNLKMFERDLLMLSMLKIGIDLTGGIVRCEYCVPDSSARLI